MHTLDVALFNTLFGLSGHSVWFDAMIIATAKYLPWIVAVVGLYAAYKAWRAREAHRVWGYVLAFLAGGIARALTEMIRTFYHHPRPALVLHITPLFPETAYSFPSGHAVFFFGLATGVCFVNKKLGKGLLIAAAAISIARVMAGVHWPSDILAGALLGICMAWIVFGARAFFAKIRSARPPRQKENSSLPKRAKKALLTLAGIFFLVLGVLGLALPFLQGVLFLAIGVVLLSIESPGVRSWLELHTRRHPKVHHLVERIQTWVSENIGTGD